MNLLKHLVLHSPFGAPVVVPKKFRSAFATLWRSGLINIWYRQDSGAAPLRSSQFVSLTVDGHRRINAVVSITPEF